MCEDPPCAVILGFAGGLRSPGFELDVEHIHHVKHQGPPSVEELVFLVLLLTLGMIRLCLPGPVAVDFTLRFLPYPDSLIFLGVEGLVTGGLSFSKESTHR